MVYPTLVGTIKTLPTIVTSENSPIGRYKSDLLLALEKRFEFSWWKPVFVVAMLLDPRFKLSLIHKDKEKVELVTQVKEIVQSYMEEVEGPQETKIRRIEKSSARV